MTRKVVVVAFAGAQALDIVGPFEVFAGASFLTEGGYDVSLSSVDGAAVSARTGLTFVTTPLPDPSEAVDTVVLPGGGGVDAARRDTELMDWVRAVSINARRIVTVCTGAFLGAEAGLLNGHRATTHWAFADRLAREFPDVQVDPDPIFIRSSEKVWTAAGVTSGIDLALSLIEDDHGTEVAQTVARWFVLYLRRPGGQTQFAAPVWIPRAKRQPIRLVQEAIESQPGAIHSVEDLAELAAMSPRHFARVFAEETGETPGHYVERVRTEAARRQLEETDDTVLTIANRCGFGTPDTMRRSFIRKLGVSPAQYRKAFS